ncbi:hypothetical protein Dsin_031404 [Dipteronia sinensis]|uniref:non-specific serine/threonine protein kinase n=1 Tax=Dipteronia sinensis TaxID=43782 RepID=A0AAD9ZL51_9ROSI|nr:hypothetical protein Dsin_031404 [Dipteronia sinensis]
MGIISKKTWFSQCFLLVLFLFLNIQFSKESDTLSPGQSLSGNQTLTSAGGIFELGFFTPGNSQNYYIGIWYKTLPNQTVVWVANRKEPLSDHFSSELKLLEDGNLVLLNQSGAAVWSTNSTSTVHNSTTAKLLDNANFVISNALSSSGVIWQSFDHPTNHWLPGGKLGYKNKTNEGMTLVSWRSPENPAPSLFSLDIARNGTGHSHLLMWNGTHQYWNSGDWTGKIFTLVPELQLNFYVTNMTLVSNENESYFTYTSAMPNAFTRFVLEVTGQLRQYVWQERNQTLTSAGGIFELGFFTPGNSQKYYIGIWYKTLPNQTVVWVANRIEPLSDHFSSEFKLLEDGNLVLLNQSGAAVWSTNSTSTVHNSTTAKLLDNANFVISNALDSSGVIWQSFDHPTNHWLPGGKFGYKKNLKNEEMTLVSWRSPENPAPSLFSLDVARNGTGHSHLLMWNGR